MRCLVACETSGRVREALRARGHEVWSIDTLPSEDNSPFHLIGDALAFLEKAAGNFDFLIAHPPCTYLANSGVRWLWNKDGSTNTVRWANMIDGARFFAAFLMQPIPKIAVENPIMHMYARSRVMEITGLPMDTSYVQPWWFGDEAFKATGFTLKGLSPIEKPATALIPPKPGTPEHKKWSVIHNMSPGPDRWKERSRTFPGIARAIAENWA